VSYLTQEIAGIGGKVKQQLEDFRVYEIPAYPCAGQGEHLYLWIEKTGITTFDVVMQLARGLHISPQDVGYAGMKDCHAITQQFFSIPLASKLELDKLTLKNAQILNVQQHINKLRIGHLRGNRFEIVVRDPMANWEENLQKIIEILQKCGIPNYFGPQRFGSQQNTDRIGNALLRNQREEALHTLLGQINPLDTNLLKEVKQFYLADKYQDAFNIIPSSFITEKHLLKLLAGGMPKATAVTRIPLRIQKFYVSAYQSSLFNQTLQTRLPEIDQIWCGDLAVKHPGRAVFLAQDDEATKLRCQGHEISPTGPMFGYKMIHPAGKQQEIEQQLLAQEHLDVDLFRAFHYKGERRSYRFFAQDIRIQKQNQIAQIFFTLPKGCYATVVLGEMMKVPYTQPDLWEDEENEDADT